MSRPSTPPPAGPLDQDTAATVDLVASDPRHEADYLRFIAAVADCADPDGLVSQNDTRTALTDEHGLTIEPHRYAGFWRRACLDGTLAWSPADPNAWDVNTDRRSGNAGKPQRRYRLTQHGPTMLHAARVPNTGHVRLYYLPKPQRRRPEPPPGWESWLWADGGAFSLSAATLCLDSLRPTAATYLDALELANARIRNVGTLTIDHGPAVGELARAIGDRLVKARRCRTYTIGPG